MIVFDEPVSIEPLVVASTVNDLAQLITAGYPGFVTSEGLSTQEQVANPRLIRPATATSNQKIE